MNRKKILLVSIFFTSIAILSGCLSTESHSAKRTITPDLFKNKSGADQIHTGICIIGSGPAGWAAAIYAARANIPTIVLTGGVEAGGLLNKTTAVENYPGYVSVQGPALMKSMQEQAIAVGVQIIDQLAVDIDTNHWPFIIKTDEGMIIHALSVVIATGARPRKLGIPGEEQYWGGGVTSCAVCDAPFYKEKEVVVVGGGDSAVEEAIQLVPFASKITILVRKPQMRAAARMQDRLKTNHKIAVKYDVSIEEIVGDGTKVTGVKLRNHATNKLEELPTSGVFLAIGHDPNSALFKGKLPMDDEGYLMLEGRSQATNIPGIFAAGEIHDKTYRQAIVAAGYGAAAGLEAINFLMESGWTAVIEEQLFGKSGQKAAGEQKTAHSGQVHEVASLDDFEQNYLNQKLLVADFYTPACSLCKKMLPSLQSLAQTMPDATFVSINAQKLPELTNRYFVSSVPCLLIFKEGSLAARNSSFMAEAAVRRLIEELA